jgi:hypothetical protein
MNDKEKAAAPDTTSAEESTHKPGAKSAMDDALAALALRKAAKYNGLVGQLPDWVPRPLRYEFDAVRNRLLDFVSVKDLQYWMDLWRSPTDNGWMYVPPEYDRDVDSLVYIQSIHDLGPEAGIDAYLGKGGMEVVRGMTRLEHNRRVSQLPRPDGLQRVIVSLLPACPKDEPAGPYIERRLRELASARREVDGVTFEGIDGDNILWHDCDNRPKESPLKGLKDRVSRALKQPTERERD